MENEKKKRRKQNNKKNKIGIVIGIILILLILSLVVIGVVLVKGRIDKLNIVEINKDDLEVNNNLFNELNNGTITKDEFEDVITIALFGSDSRNVTNMSSGRTDSIIIASLNPKTKSIKLLSIPRDTYVNIPGYGMDKINHAYAYGGEQLLIKTINSNFGLAITEFVTIDFLGLAKIINAMGGIEIEITKAEMEVINQYLIEIYELEGKQYVPLNKYGKITLNGEQAVAHCRNRYVGSDFTRAERQRNVITAVVNKVSTLEINKALGLIDVALEQVSTNVDVTKYLGKLTNVVTNVNEYKDNIISAQIPSSEYGSDKMINGIYYFAADLNKAKEDFKTYLYEK